MLTLLIGTDWTENRRVVLEKLAQDVAQERGGRILMVPELVSHDTERRLCAAAGDTASRFAEVLSFSRLARRVSDAVGQGLQECLDDGGRVVAMAAAARSLHSRLKAYASVETRPEFLSGMVDAVDEFKRCCITARDLMAAAGQTEGSLAQKLEELSLLLECYDGLCSHGRRDPRDQMTWLLGQMEESTFAEEHVFYIDGFPDLTRQHMAILEHLIRRSPEVTVSLNCDAPHSTALAFEKAGSTAGQLLRCAKQAGVEVRVCSVAPRADALEPLRRRLFQGKAELQPQLADAVRVYRCQSVYDECLAAAEQIRELVRSGARYRDISVVCADMPAYSSVVRMVFDRCRIPTYQSGTEDILERSVITTVLAAVDAALGGFEQKDVLRYAKSMLSPLDLQMSDRLENYAIMWSITGSRWQQPWTNHPSGLGEQWTERSQQELAQLESARQLLIGPLAALQKGFRDAPDLRRQVQALYAFLEDIRLAGRLGALAGEMDAAGDNRNAQILSQLWEILLCALEQLYDVLGQTVWEPESFTRLLRLLLSQYDVGTIPPVLDSVTVGSVSAMRCQQVRYLFVLGADEGSLPGYGGSAGILTDQERTALRSLGVPLTGGSIEGLQAEFAEIYGVFCGAQERIYISCAGAQPSFVYRRVLDMVGTERPVTDVLGAAGASAQEAAALLARCNAPVAAQKLGLGEEYRSIDSRRRHTLGAVSRENIERLYGRKLRLSASQVDRQADCRMSYFLRYGLRAKERKSITVDPAEFGTYVHAVLEETAKRVMQLGGFHQVSLEQTLDIAREESAAYAAERFAQIDSQRIEYLFRRNAQELEMVVQELWQELQSSSFAPVGFEVSFGDGAQLPAIEIPGRTMQAQLRGFVDRVDVWQDGVRSYFRVVDYKTGRKDFDYCDVFNGLGLQMLLYLFALEDGGESVVGRQAIPAGVQYFPARAPLVSADGVLTDEESEAARQKLWKRKGLLLNSQAVLEAMEPGDAPTRLSIKRKKDGTVTGDLADPQQLALLRSYVFALLGKLVDDIASGCVEPNPYTRGSSHSACAFCPYASICHEPQVEGRRNYKEMSAQRFWEETAKEMSEHGTAAYGTAAHSG